MPTYTVHQPPLKAGQTASDPQRFLFVRDGFYFWGFVLAPLWLLAHRLWLAFTLYLAANVLLRVALSVIGVSSNVQWLAGLLIALLVGFEAATIWRRKLARRGWKMLGFVIGDDAETAERRFFAEWTRRAGATPSAPPAVPEPRYAAPVRRGPPSPSDVIGLFPEPRA
jgi:hypothetical protein